MPKLQRIYAIEFEIGWRGNNRDEITSYNPEQILYVAYPTTLQMNIEMNPFSQMGTGKFVIYNLNENSRALLYKDNFDQKKYVTMRLYAGYDQGSFQLCFAGDFRQCYSYRESGSVDFLTVIEATNIEYIFRHGYAGYTFAKGTPPEMLIKTLLGDIPNVEIGYISPTLTANQYEQTYWGKTFDLIKETFSGYQVIVENNQLNIIASDEVLPSSIPVISSKTGLLGSPKRSGMVIDVQMLFEPGIICGQSAQLISDTLPYLNNTYKVMAYGHNGIISPTQSGKLITNVTLSLGGYIFQQLKKLTEQQQAQKAGSSAPQTGWTKPTSGGTITSAFGYRQSFETSTGKSSSNHKGIDIGIPMRTSVVACNNGIVQFAGSQSGYGYTVQIDHGKNKEGKTIISQYSHLDEFKCSTGQSVGSGQQIALSGGVGPAYKAGSSTGPHLHFEIRENGIPVNPSKYIGNY